MLSRPMGGRELPDLSMSASCLVRVLCAAGHRLMELS